MEVRVISNATVKSGVYELDGAVLAVDTEGKIVKLATIAKEAPQRSHKTKPSAPAVKVESANGAAAPKRRGRKPKVAVNIPESSIMVKEAEAPAQQ